MTTLGVPEYLPEEKTKIIRYECPRAWVPQIMYYT